MLPGGGGGAAAGRADDLGLVVVDHDDVVAPEHGRLLPRLLPLLLVQEVGGPSPPAGGRHPLGGGVEVAGEGVERLLGAGRARLLPHLRAGKHRQ